MPSFFRFFLPAGFLFLACAAGFDASSLQKKFLSASKKWKKEIEGAKNAAYLVHFDASGPKGKGSGSIEIYWLAGDTAVLFSPGLFGKGSLRGRWVLGESFLVYFPREKSYYKGSWEDFLLGIKSQTLAVDSLIFGILSRRAFLAGADSLLPEMKNGLWTASDRLGSWERQFIFNRLGRPSRLVWKESFLAVKAEAELTSTTLNAPFPKRLEWEYFMQEAKAKFDVEHAVTNAQIPASKRNFKIPPDAVQLERIDVNEEP
ncbi:MAG: hypothetical protein L0196_04480 [candidate division Zixibacteria bacterium]|nr:hypothetical protein [candidate division Zixibacteria bacterium]